METLTIETVREFVSDEEEVQLIAKHCVKYFRTGLYTTSKDSFFPLNVYNVSDIIDWYEHRIKYMNEGKKSYPKKLLPKYTDRLSIFKRIRDA